MTKLCPLPQNSQPTRLSRGDCVRYTGADPKVQQDYGNQDLCIVAIDFMSGIAVCSNKTGQCLVGVALYELQGL